MHSVFLKSTILRIIVLEALVPLMHMATYAASWSRSELLFGCTFGLLILILVITVLSLFSLRGYPTFRLISLMSLVLYLSVNAFAWWLFEHGSAQD